VGRAEGAAWSAGFKQPPPIELAEIGEIELGLPAKLLRVLQDGSFERVGDSSTTSSRVMESVKKSSRSKGKRLYSSLESAQG
jgi:hypothetical protein